MRKGKQAKRRQLRARPFARRARCSTPLTLSRRYWRTNNRWRAPMPIPAIGEPLPAFSGRLSDGQLIRRDDLAGSFTTLCFFGSAGVPQMAAMVNAVTQNGDIFDGLEHRFVGVSIDPDDAERLSSISGTPPAVQWIFDFDQQLSHLFGAAIEQGHDEEVPFQPLTVLVDASLRVLACHKISDPQEHANTLPQFLSQLPIQGPPRPANAQAPVLF